MKAAAEARLKASGLSWTIVRPTAYQETWLEIVGRPLVATGQTRVFGRGRNPINFVSAGDVARVVELAVTSTPALRGATIDVAGTREPHLRPVRRRRPRGRPASTGIGEPRAARRCFG